MIGLVERDLCNNGGTSINEARSIHCENATLTERKHLQMPNAGYYVDILTGCHVSQGACHTSKVVSAVVVRDLGAECCCQGEVKKLNLACLRIRARVITMWKEERVIVRAMRVVSTNCRRTMLNPTFSGLKSR